MPNQTPLIYERDAQQQKLIEELRHLMLADSALAGHETLLNDIYLYSQSFPPPQHRSNDPRRWVDGQRHLAGFVDECSKKFSIVSFQVLDWRRNAHSAFFDEVVIEIDLYAQVSRLNGEPFSIHMISPNDDDPVRYQNIFVFRGGSAIDATNLQVGDLIERFPRVVENILDQIGFVADVILTEEPR